MPLPLGAEKRESGIGGTRQFEASGAADLLCSVLRKGGVGKGDQPTRKNHFESNHRCVPPSLFVGSSLAGWPRLDFLQAMAGAGIEIKIVEALQFLNAFQRGWAERRFSVEGMKHDALQKIAQGHTMVFGEGLQDFEQALLHAHASLNAFDHQL